MPKIIKTMGEGHAKGELYALLDALLVDIAAQKVIIDELILDHATSKTSHDAMETLIEELHDDHATSKLIVDELVADHATFKTCVDEIEAWAEALATKLNADAGVTDVDYDAVITASAPATLTNAGPATLTAAKPASGPATLTAVTTALTVTS